MKNITVKKALAGAAVLALGAASLGTAFAANVGGEAFTPVVREDVFNANGVPAANIVIGAGAQPVDVVWAGNIAAAIGKQAHTSTAVEGGSYTFNNVVVEVGSESSSTVSGDGKLFDDTGLAATISETIDKDDYSLLYDEDVSIDDDESNVVDDEINVKDSLSFTADVAFDNDKDVGALTATVDKADISYVVEFDDGVPFGYDDSGSPKFKFKFMGKTFQVEELNAAGNTLTLVESQATVTYGAGDSFVPEEGFTIEVISILDNGADSDPYEVELVLKNAEGVEVARDVFQTGDEKVFEDELSASIDVDTVYATQVKLITGSSGKLELKDGDEIEDFPNTDDELWKVDFTEGKTNFVTAITVTNNDSSVQFKNEEALRIGDEIELPNDFAKIQFLGLTSESETEFTIEDNVITYVDTDDEDHDLFVFESDDGSDIDEWTTDSKIDGKELYIALDATDGNLLNNDDHYSASFTVQLEDDEGDYLGADGQWSSTATTYYVADDGSIGTTAAAYDGNANTDVAGDWYDLNIASYNNDDVEFVYGVYLKEASDKITEVAFGLKEGVAYDISGGDATWKVNGVAFDVTSTYNDDATYAGTKTSAADIVEAEVESVVEFLVNDGDDTKIYIDPWTGELADTEDDDYDAGSNQVDSENANLGIHDSDDLTEAYTDFGSVIAIDSGKFTATIPEDALKAKFFIGGGSSTETTLNGATLTLTTEGEVVEGEGVSAKLVSKDIAGVAGEEGTFMIPANWNVSTDQLVFLDNEAPAGPQIIVGGYLVNNLAKDSYDLENLVVASGDYVYGKAANGNIVVAGMDAADTAMAAKDLIAAIEAM